MKKLTPTFILLFLLVYLGNPVYSQNPDSPDSPDSPGSVGAFIVSTRTEDSTRTHLNQAEQITVFTPGNIERPENSHTTTVQHFDMDDIPVYATENFINAFSGRVAGVSIRHSSGNMAGSTDISFWNWMGESYSPLIIVDGIRYNNSPNNDYMNGKAYDYGNIIFDIDPYNIETVTFQRGGSAAIYGVDAIAGVILITTKGHSQDEGLKVTFNSSVISEKANLLPVYQNIYGGGYSNRNGGSDWFTTEEIYGTEYDVVQFSSSSWGPMFTNQQVLQWDAFDEWDTENYLQTREWKVPEHGVEDFLNAGLSFQNNISIYGGYKKSAFRLSYSNVLIHGYLPNSSLDKNALSFSGHVRVLKRIEADLTVNYVDNYTLGRPSTGGNHNNVIRNINCFSPRQLDYYRLRNYMNPDGSQRTYLRSSWDNTDAYLYDNPYWIRYQNFEDDQRGHLYGKTGLKWNITDWLFLQSNAFHDQYDYIQKERMAVGSVYNSSYREKTVNWRETNVESMLCADFGIKDILTIKTFGGANLRNTKYHILSMSSSGGLSVPGIYTIENSVSVPTVYKLDVSNKVNSLFANSVIGFKETFYTEIALRKDWINPAYSQRTGLNYSISSGFVFSKLKVFQNYDGLSFGRIRGSIWNGRMKAEYTAISYYSSPSSGLEEARSTFLAIEGYNSIDAGIDLGFMNNRLNFSMNWYTIRNFLRNSVESDQGSIISSESAYTNKGIDFSIKWKVLENIKLLSWDIGMVWTANSNVLESDISYIIHRVYDISVTANDQESYGTLYGTDYLYDPEGNKIVDASGLYLSTPEDVFLGNTRPDWIAGVTNHFRYKNFDFSFLIDISKGGKYFSETYMYGIYQGILEETAKSEHKQSTIREYGLILDGVSAVYLENGDLAYNPDGSVSTGGTNNVIIPAFDWARNHTASPQAQNLFNADYVKLRDLRFSYTISCQQIALVEKIKVSVFGKNLALWGNDKRNPHIDPEYLYNYYNLAGIETGALPGIRQLGLSISAEF